ncbi:FadR/GntR family transcriptional regulator [Pseudarthrobacter sp. N5]|uniref:FadR/GntR family transcriptional regulator n=1 Tax=Pseudarthrobacter sp. N5 TaxID=3418416 RepID=UPI003CF032F9
MDTDNFPGGAFKRSRAGTAEQAPDDLRSKILSGALPRGTRQSSEKEFAAYYDVSEPTAREAIRALGAISLVGVRPGAGTFIIAESSAITFDAMTAVVQLEGIDLLGIFDRSETLSKQAVSLAVDLARHQEPAGLRLGPGLRK